MSSQTYGAVMWKRWVQHVGNYVRNTHAQSTLPTSRTKSVLIWLLESTYFAYRFLVQSTALAYVFTSVIDTKSTISTQNYYYNYTYI